jgi:hypothetical protein
MPLKVTNILTLLLFAVCLSAAAPVLANQCVDCHTDVEKLKSIAKNLPRPETSSETAGKG